jgi:hypothetical protein
MLDRKVILEVLGEAVERGGKRSRTFCPEREKKIRSPDYSRKHNEKTDKGQGKNLERKIRLDGRTTRSGPNFFFFDELLYF